MPSAIRQKTPKNQELARREPRQARSLHKLELMLEAAMRILDEKGIEALTTNAVAEKAGVSIGTLYQYFSDKEALLDALVKRHISSMGDRIKAGLTSTPSDARGGRVRPLMNAVLSSYGGRNKVHRQLIQHSMTRTGGTRINPMYAQIVEMLTRGGMRDEHNAQVKMSAAQAFVLTHALAGVMRGLIANERIPPKQEVEDALVKLVVGFASVSGRA